MKNVAEQVKMRVLKKHFDAAIKARENGKSTVGTCLIAQAACDTFSTKTVAVGFSALSVETRKKTSFYDLDAQGKDLIASFDMSGWRDGAKLRASLPATVVVTFKKKVDLPLKDL